MGIRERDTTEVAPLARRGGPATLLGAVAVLVALAFVAAAVALALSPGLRHRLIVFRTPLVTVAIDSTPSGADVFIDENPFGATPAQARLAPGRHDVRIVIAGYKPWRQAFDAAQTRHLAPGLQPVEVATLIVESQPSGAHVFLDGVRRGVTPVALGNLEAGTHSVRVDGAPVYQAVTSDVRLAVGETRRLALRLASRLEARYRERIEKQPGNVANYTELAHHFLAEERAEDAAAITTKALQVLDGVDTSSIEFQQFHAQLGLICVARADGAAAPASAGKALAEAVLALFAKLAATRPNEPVRYLPLATVLARAGRFAEVVAACDAALQPGQGPTVHLALAESCLSQGSPAQAIALLERATKLRPDNYYVHARLAAACHRAERYDDALREYGTALRLAAAAPAEQRTRLQAEMARVLADKGDLNGAVACYEKALGLDAGGVDLAKGLVAHYPFDKDASDASGKNHHGENHGATLVAGGKAGGAFSFDGTTAYVSIPAQATKGLGAATFALWVKTSHTGAATRSYYWMNPALIGVATDGYGSGDFALMLRQGTVAYYHGLSPNGTDVAWFSDVAVSDGAWHHVAFVNAGPLVLAYVDGKLTRGEAALGSGALVSDTPSGGVMGEAPLFIGANNVATGQSRAGCFYQGLIDDVRIWNRPLRAAEILALRASAK